MVIGKKVTFYPAPDVAKALRTKVLEDVGAGRRSMNGALSEIINEALRQYLGLEKEGEKGEK